MEISSIQQQIKENIEVTEEQLDSIYAYLSIFSDSMKEEELKMWAEILNLVDKDFKEQDYE